MVALNMCCFVVDRIFGPNFAILSSYLIESYIENCTVKVYLINTSFCCDLNFDKIYSLFGVNFVLLKSCWCKILDI